MWRAVKNCPRDLILMTAVSSLAYGVLKIYEMGLNDENTW